MCVGVFLVVLNILAVVWYVLPGGPDQWKNDVVPGKVVSLSDTILTTVDPRGVEKEFIITTETRVFAGKKPVDREQVTVGSLVLVKLNTATTTAYVAQDIRIMTDARKAKKESK